MTQVEKLERQLLSCPLTFRFSDAVRVMERYGFELDNKGKTSGSRIRFYRKEDGRMFIMHVPHPGDELSSGAVRSIVRFLQDVGRLS